jgi:hypothetical protein
MHANVETQQAEKIGAAKNQATKNGTSEANTPDRPSGLEKRDSPMSSVLTEATNPRASKSKSRQERRKLRRAGVKVLVRLRPANGKDEKFEEVLGTKNASLANVYVISANKCYYKQMPLRVTYPFDSAHDGDSTSENTAEVVRLDHLPDGRVGVAIHFREPITTTAKKLNSNRKPEEERRFAVRYTLSAAAKLIELESTTRLQARCADLSMAGCYIDTLNPFPENSSVHLQITHKQKTIEVGAHVITHHPGMGMGLVFDKLTPEQTNVLVDWLSKRDARPRFVAEQSATPEQAAAPAASGSSDRALVLKLLRVLESKGKMTQDELSGLLSHPVDV